MKRNTTQKMAIKKVFTEHNRALSIDEVLTYGQKIVASLNQATVYRNLKALAADGWLKKVTHPTLGTLFERTGKGHHHLFHCRNCNRAFDMPGCLLKEKGLAPKGFVVEDHEVFLFGICPACTG